MRRSLYVSPILIMGDILILLALLGMHTEKGLLPMLTVKVTMVVKEVNINMIMIMIIFLGDILILLAFLGMQTEEDPLPMLTVTVTVMIMVKDMVMDPLPVPMVPMVPMVLPAMEY